MYSNVRDLVRGLLKNATEGMAKPAALPVWTLLLLGGHVLPWILLAAALVAGATPSVLLLLGLACALPLGARLLQARRCREPLGAVPLHPSGVLMPVALQWTALVRQRLGIETAWRGRTYQAQT